MLTKPSCNRKQYNLQSIGTHEMMINFNNDFIQQTSECNEFKASVRMSCVLVAEFIWRCVVLCPSLVQSHRESQLTNFKQNTFYAKTILHSIGAIFISLISISRTRQETFAYFLQTSYVLFPFPPPLPIMHLIF